MGRYMFSVIHPDRKPSVHDDVDLDAIMAAVGALNETWMAEDRMIFGAGLKPAATARVATPSADLTEVTVTDGPFLESKEVLGGFWIIRAEEHEVAELHAAAARACQTVIECRALEDEPEE